MNEPMTNMQRHQHYTAARTASLGGSWTEAAWHYERAGEPENAGACRRIAAAIERGDRFRARVAELVDGGQPYVAALRQADREIYGQKSADVPV